MKCYEKADIVIIFKTYIWLNITFGEKNYEMDHLIYKLIIRDPYLKPVETLFVRHSSDPLAFEKLWYLNCHLGSYDGKTFICDPNFGCPIDIFFFK